MNCSSLIQRKMDCGSSRVCDEQKAVVEPYFGKKTVMSVFAIKIRIEGNGSKVIPILRRFEPSLSIGEIRKRMQSDDFVVKYDLLHWNITEEMAGIDRISKFESLIQSLEEYGAQIEIYNGDELISKEFFENSMQMLREIADEVDEDMDREAAGD